MELLFYNEISSKLKKDFMTCKEAFLITGYLTSGVFSILDDRLLPEKYTSLFFRGNKQDFFNGSVCIKTVRKLYELGVRCYLVRNLHSKIYIFDKKIMYIGSVNLTNNGLSLLDSSNIEVLYKTKYESSYDDQLRESLKYAIEVTDDILSEIEHSMLDVEDKQNTAVNLNSIDWPFWSKDEYLDSLSDLSLPRCNLFIPLIEQKKDDLAHDQLHFGLDDNLSFNRSLFITSALHHFLVKEVLSKPEGRRFIRFGELKNILSDKFELENIDAKKITQNIFSYYNDRKCLPLNYERVNYTESLNLQL